MTPRYARPREGSEKPGACWCETQGTTGHQPTLDAMALGRDWQMDAGNHHDSSCTGDMIASYGKLPVFILIMDNHHDLCGE